MKHDDHQPGHPTRDPRRAVVAIVDGYSTGKYIAAQLRDLGATCFHLTSQPTMPELFTRSFDSGCYEEDLAYQEDFDRIAAALEQRGVTAVVPGTESGVLLADRLSHRLGLPGNAPSQRRARRDKYLMARVVAAAGLRAPASDLVENPAMARSALLASRATEVVVKPLSSAGADNVHFCRSAAEAAEAARAVLEAVDLFGSPNRYAVVQERLLGVEHYVNSVSIDGRHLMVETWRYTKCSGPSGGLVYDFEEPVGGSTTDAAELHEFTRQVLDALGIKNGAAHTEIMLTSTGPVLVETGARLGGATQPSVTERYSGTSQTRALAHALVGDQAAADIRPSWTQPVRNVSLVNHVPGSGTTTWADALARLASVVAVVPATTGGSWLDVTRDLASAPGFVYLSHPDERQVAADYATIRDLEHRGLYTSAGGTAPGAAQG
ncbi:ATP-grasp domain-containing protein [Nocardioides stalactiti]|uniref:ATP-grasp domain-containing protein n=1 Tax=Nocardioides stalactiti TaxID=2755356 RepID=UPI001603D0AA|nr:ATP-grasp domain-containing protein [Nocardioides stalactiti]